MNTQEFMKATFLIHPIYTDHDCMSWICNFCYCAFMCEILILTTIQIGIQLPGSAQAPASAGLSLALLSLLNHPPSHPPRESIKTALYRGR
jgi:hypothetical protein